MSILGWFRRLFGGLQRDDPQRTYRYPLPYLNSGVHLTPDEALNISTAWACVDAIGKAIASCCWSVNTRGRKGRRETIADDPVGWLLNCRPNPDMTAIALKEALLYTAIPFGNAYLEIVPDRAGRVAQLWPLDGFRVMPHRDLKTGALSYRYQQQDGAVVELPPERVFHLRGPGLSGFLGENIVARAIKAISVAAAQERYAASFFGRGATPAGVLKYPGVLSDEQYKRLRDDWAEKHAGPEHAHKPLILEEGMLWEESKIDPQKSQAVESRQFSVEEICRWFGVPPHKVQHLARATFNNIEHLSIEFVRDALTPWARRLEQEADFKLFGDRTNKFTSIDMAPLTYGDAKSRADAHAVWRQNGVLSANEIRDREGMNHVGPEGDVLLVQSNMTTIDRILNPPAPVAVPGAAAEPEGDEPAGGDDAGGGEGDPPSEVEGRLVAAEAVRVFLISACDRYSRRLAARRLDLERRELPAAEIEANIAGERKRLLPKTVAELEPAQYFALVAFGRRMKDEEISKALNLAEDLVNPNSAAGEVLFPVAQTSAPALVEWAEELWPGARAVHGPGEHPHREQETALAGART